MTPIGWTEVPVVIVTRVTLTGPTVLPAPVSDSVMVPTAIPGVESPPGVTATDRSRAPLPDVGLTTSHGWLDVAVHETAGPLDCVSRIT